MNIKDLISSGLLELYATGIASAAEKEAVENWIKKYPEIATALTDIQLGLEAYAQASAIEPGKDVKEKIFTAINSVALQNNLPSQTNVNGQAKIINLKNYWKWIAAASIILLLGSVFLNMQYYKKYNATSKNLQQTRQQLALEQQRTNDFKQDLDIVHNPYSKAVSLQGQEVLPSAVAKIFWITNTGEVMIDASNLPDAPAGKQYQFWAIVDGIPQNGGLIITDDKSKKIRMQRMKTFGKAQAFAISLEKKGGNPTPTTVVSVGKI